MQVLATYSLDRAVDFVLYLYDKENEETLWEMWLSKDIEKDFKEFKKEQYHTIRKNPVDLITKDKERENLDFASQFINFKKGELDGAI